MVGITSYALDSLPVDGDHDPARRRADAAEAADILTTRS
jgi:hypothetical protein